jgi:acetylornithine/succinyldiaminopimelate/putrescine aminotransferase
MGATVATAEVAAAMKEDGSYYSTYGWHPRSVAAALATLRYLKQHQRASRTMSRS